MKMFIIKFLVQNVVTGEIVALRTSIAANAGLAIDQIVDYIECNWGICADMSVASEDPGGEYTWQMESGAWIESDAKSNIY